MRGLAVAVLIAWGGAAAAQPLVGYDWAPADYAAAPYAQDDWPGEEAGIGPFFYSGGYDPQYGSAGRVADAEDFAAGYGCRSIWNTKTGQRIPACN